ncbi:MAG: hypothetical protein AB1758_30260, partial [Candidatus Eremiobacterota bacterium]
MERPIDSVDSARESWELLKELREKRPSEAVEAPAAAQEGASVASDGSSGGGRSVPTLEAGEAVSHFNARDVSRRLEEGWQGIAGVNPAAAMSSAWQSYLNEPEAPRSVEAPDATDRGGPKEWPSWPDSSKPKPVGEGESEESGIAAGGLAGVDPKRFRPKKDEEEEDKKPEEAGDKGGGGSGSGGPSGAGG